MCGQDKSHHLFQREKMIVCKKKKKKEIPACVNSMMIKDASLIFVLSLCIFWCLHKSIGMHLQEH